MTYICRFKLNVGSRKSYSKEPYKHDMFFKGYGELNLQANGDIAFNVKIGNGKRDYRIRIGKWAMFQMFMYHLSLRPIWQRKNTMYISKDIHNVEYDDIDRVPIDTIITDYKDAVKRLNVIIPTMSGEHQERAETQMRKLLDRQWKVDILRQIQLSNEIKTNALPK